MNTSDIFIDETCHLENDHIPVMCIGYIKVPTNGDVYEGLKNELKEIFSKYNQNSELKWQKFSKARLSLYKELVDYFFQSPLEFRCILVKYKDRLNHKDFNQGSHDNFYYKLIYYLLRVNNSVNSNIRVFIDVKDTRGKEKLVKINEVLENEFKEKTSFNYFQHLHSDHNIFFQLADFFIGAVAYKSRVSSGNIIEPTTHKLEFINYLEEKSGFNLDEGTEPWETKFNIFDHQPKRRI